MACYRPLKAYRAEGGGVAWSSKAGYLDRPLELPCGKCIGCRLELARSWSLRCAHEAQLHERNCFVTLTYDEAHLPADGSLVRSHWVDFAKRLRKAGLSFRYLMCGEYGGRSLRPHYHALLFGQDFHEDREVWQTRNGYRLYTSAFLAKKWGHGFVTIGNLTRETAEYVARYTLKKVGGALREERYRRIDVATGEEFEVEPEYATMSRRPGLGSGWYDRFKDDLFPSDEVIHDGRRYPVPRFYVKRLESSEPLRHARLRAARARRAAEGAVVPVAGLPASGVGEHSPERLETREGVALSKVRAREEI